MLLLISILLSFILMLPLVLVSFFINLNMQARCSWLRAGREKMLRIILPLICALTTSLAQARQIEGVNFPDETQVNGTKLVLNGAGLRTKRKFGMNWRVYVAGLYLPSKTQDAAAIVSSANEKMLELIFLRSVDKDTLREAWSEGFEKNCKSDCEAARGALKSFNELMVDVQEKSRLRLTFEKDAVSVEVEGKTVSRGKIPGEAFRRAVLAIFIGDEPPTPDLKKGLLGGA